MTDVIIGAHPSRALDERPRTPLRRAGSIRRTTTLTMFRPADWEGPLLLEGIGRDLATSPEGEAIALCEDRMSATVVRPDMLDSLSITPDWPEMQMLVGSPAIAGFRRRLSDNLADRPDRERPLGTLLDDMAACTLISGWALILQPGSALYDYKPDPARRSRMAGVCIGLSAESDSFQDYDRRAEPVQVLDVRHPDDPDGWHIFSPTEPFQMRRARRIDVWHEEGRLMVDAMFQDSALVGDGTRRAVHDYGLKAAFDADDGILVAIEAEPRILPHNACPLAIDGIRAMIGTTAPLLRAKVLDDLRGVAGCTHLNDATRALAAVPWLGKRLADSEAG